MPDEDLFNRVGAEFLEMPGLRLKREQLQRLFGVDRAVCQRILETLLATRFLCVRVDGTYARSSYGTDVPRPQPTQATVGTANPSLKAS